MDRKEPKLDSESAEARRQFLKQAGRAAAVAPAATLLLAAHTKRAMGQIYRPADDIIGDDDSYTPPA